MRLVLFFFAGLAWVVSAKAAVVETASSSFACASVLTQPLPKEPPFSEAARASLKDCRAADEYYGLGSGTSDFNRARRCAWLERESGWTPGSLGPAVLMMTYANGQGAPRDRERAVRFVCESLLTADLKVSWIEYLRRTKVDKTNIDYCDRAGTGPDEAACILVRKRQQGLAREAKFRALAVSFSADERQRLETLLKVAAKFFELDTAWRNSGNLNGAARASFRNGHEAYAWDQLDIWMTRLERQKRISLSGDLLVEIDDRLNKRYRELRATLPAEDRAEFQKAQRAWIDFRDAFVAFAMLRYAPKQNSVWLTELTRRRIAEMAF